MQITKVYPQGPYQLRMEDIYVIKKCLIVWLQVNKETNTKDPKIYSKTPRFWQKEESLLLFI